MLRATENEMFTRVGRGTPAGEWLRRYWLPIAISDKWVGIKTLWKCDEQFVYRGRLGTVSEFGRQLGNFTGKPTAVRILGEDLVLFRDGSGRLGLLGLHCPHRATSLEFGRVRQDGLECCYHGWRFDVDGKCLDQPAEPVESAFKDKVRHLAYPVREMGGLIWAYLGPAEAPVLPKLDVVAREDGIRAVENYGLWPCNYFQAIENSPDTTHTGILHGGPGERSDIWGREIPQPSWEENEFGIMTRSRRSTTVRSSQFLLPVSLRLTQPWPGYKLNWPRFSAIWKVPVDDDYTLHFSAVFTPFINGKAPELPKGLTFDITDELTIHRLQDYQAIISQGQIYDRTTERLGSSDGGIILLRKMVREGIDAVQRGEDPKGVWRSPSMDRILDFSDTSTDSSFTVTAAALAEKELRHQP